MTEQFPERRDQSEPAPQSPVADLFRQVTLYNQAFVHGKNPWVAKGMDAFHDLVESGIDEDTARNNVRAIEGQDEIQAKTRIHRLIANAYHTTLAESGLNLQADTRLTLEVTDGLLFSQSLETVEPSPAIARDLTSFFNQYLGQLTGSGADNDAEAQKVFGELPDWWVEAGETQLSNQEHHSLHEILTYTSVLAARLEALGGNAKTAELMRHAATFAREGDLAPWAIASTLSLVPQVSEPSFNYWLDADLEACERQAANLLKLASPHGSFFPYLKESCLASLNEAISLARHEEFKQLIQIKVRLETIQ